MESESQLERFAPFRWLAQMLLFAAGIGLSATVNLITALQTRSISLLQWGSIALSAGCAACLFIASAKSESARYRLALRQSSDRKDFSAEFSGFVGGRSWVWLGGILGAVALAFFYLSLPSTTKEPRTEANLSGKTTPAPTATP